MCANMILEKKKKPKTLHKKLLRLKTNPLNNNKFLNLVIEEKELIKYKIYKGKHTENKIIKKRFIEIAKKKTKKWETFLRLLVKTNHFFQKYRPYTFHQQNASKFASQGNSFQKQYRKDLFTKKIFNIYYGGLKRKPLKKKMTKIYKSSSRQKSNPGNLCIEIFESRLDAILRKTNFCSTIKEAKQAISHKHVKVNNKIENNYGHILKQGDRITIANRSHKIIRTRLETKFKERFDKVLWPTNPAYLNVNYNTLEIIIGDIKDFKFYSSFYFKNDNNLVIDSYSRH